MRILFLNRSYYPDVEATGQLLTELCSDLARRHAVTVIAGQPNFVSASGTGWGLLEYDRHKGVEIVRTRNVRFTKRNLLGRALGLLSYLLLALAAACRHRRSDVIVVETDPPFLGALGAFLKWWHRCPLVYYLQDLYPEVALVLGKLRPGLLTALLRWMTQLGLRRADRVVVLGEDMRQRVLDRGIAAAKIVLVPNWIDTALVRPIKADNPLRKEWGLDGRFVVMYSGNLGLSQNLEQLLVAAKELRDEPVVFLFVGEGAAKAELLVRTAEWALDNVRFLPYQAKERLAESLSAADLHVIPLQRGLAGFIVPSKLYGILAAGTAYVAAVDAESEVARVTTAHGTGLVIEPDTPSRLAEAIRWAVAHRAEVEQMGQRGRALAETCYDRRRAVSGFERVLEEATSNQENPDSERG